MRVNYGYIAPGNFKNDITNKNKKEIEFGSDRNV